MTSKALLAGKTAVVTGANGGIGRSIVRKLAALGAEVVVVCRDEKKALGVKSEVVKATSNENIHCETCDLSSYASVSAFTKRYIESKKPLHILINNAAVVSEKKELSVDGFEMQFATNVLSYFWLTQQLLPVLKSSAPSRVVMVASRYAGDLDLKDVNFTTRKYDPNTAYKQSKQCDRMLAFAFSERHLSDNILINSCHPGVVTTTLLSNLGFGSGFDSADTAAETPVYLASSPEVKTGGQFYVSCKSQTDGFLVKKNCDALYDMCNEITTKLKTAAAEATSKSDVGEESSVGSTSTSSTSTSASGL